MGQIYLKVRAPHLFTAPIFIRLFIKCDCMVFTPVFHAIRLQSFQIKYAIFCPFYFISCQCDVSLNKHCVIYFIFIKHYQRQLFRCECDQLLLRAAVSYLSTYFRRMHSHMNGDQLEQYLEGMELSKTFVIYTLETTHREECIDILICCIKTILI